MATAIKSKIATRYFSRRGSRLIFLLLLRICLLLPGLLPCFARLLLCLALRVLHLLRCGRLRDGDGRRSKQNGKRNGGTCRDCPYSQIESVHGLLRCRLSY
ncbi:hypothetical protein [Paraburkholderia franconis]|uniref:hypothetical protein n=1 Tax=Paraburkholderia franconis TaxID=2654983 RepID=UPI00187B3E83|nr:hypothetical protein [Paraburkholderia franconis]